MLCEETACPLILRVPLHHARPLCDVDALIESPAILVLPQESYQSPDLSPVTHPQIIDSVTLAERSCLPKPSPDSP